MSILNSTILRVFLFIILLAVGFWQDSSRPFYVDSLFDFNDPNTLGLKEAEGKETYTIFSPDSNQNKYNHGLVLYPFKGKLYAQWQSSLRDEDAADTQVFYACSENGKDWCEPISLTAQYADGIKTSGGWWSHNDTLVAYVCVWPENSTKSKEGYTEYMTSADGKNWSAPKQVLNKEGMAVSGIIEQDLHKLPNGRIITAFHMEPGLRVNPYFTDDPLAISDWTAGNMKNLPSKEGMSRELEPSWFYRAKDTAVVMVFRDQKSTFKKLASISYDNGQRWSIPEIVDTPDSRAKQSAGNLADGTAFMVNNPSANKNRFPLVITLSEDGYFFDRALLLRSGGEDDLQVMRCDGKYKRRGYSYPKSVIWKDWLYVGYATNKEDIELTRIPLKNLVK